MDEDVDPEDSPTLKLADFERDLLDWFSRHTLLPELAFQLEQAAPVAREYTGVGLFLKLKVNSPKMKLLPPTVPSPIEGPEILAPILVHGAGSLLFHENGLIRLLEVFTYAEELSESPLNYSFRYRNSSPSK